MCKKGGFQHAKLYNMLLTDIISPCVSEKRKATFPNSDRKFANVCQREREREMNNIDSMTIFLVATQQ